jgi:glycosyltransferase involved in cell wall biosynthesis
MTQPAVSIIVPIYNGSAFLLETLEALASQTFSNFELLAIDDGSTDDSCDIVRSLKDDRIRLIQKANAGLCCTLNLGIELAAAPYIARCDQDDVSYPDRLERQMQAMTAHPEALGVFAYSSKIGGRHTWSNADKVTMAPGAVKEFEPLKDGCMLGSTMFCRTADLRATGGFREEYYPADDWDLELRLAQRGTVLIMREALIAYRFHAGANTYRTFLTMQQKSRWAMDSFEKRDQSLAELSFEEFVMNRKRGFGTMLNRSRKDFSRLQMRVAGQRLLDGHYISGVGHLLLSAALKPSNLLLRLQTYSRRSRI